MENRRGYFRGAPAPKGRGGGFRQDGPLSRISNVTNRVRMRSIGRALTIGSVGIGCVGVLLYSVPTRATGDRDKRDVQLGIGFRLSNGITSSAFVLTNRSREPFRTSPVCTNYNRLVIVSPDGKQTERFTWKEMPEFKEPGTYRMTWKARTAVAQREAHAAERSCAARRNCPSASATSGEGAGSAARPAKLCAVNSVVTPREEPIRASPRPAILRAFVAPLAIIVTPLMGFSSSGSWCSSFTRSGRRSSRAWGSGGIPAENLVFPSGTWLPIGVCHAVVAAPLRAMIKETWRNPLWAT